MTPIKVSLAARAVELAVFQSLFFWMTPIKPGRPVPALVDLRVSILVLLDDSHQVLEHVGEDFDFLVFQSLFFWMTPIKRGNMKTLEILEKFQSLFFWMTPIKSS